MDKKRCSWCNLKNPLYVKYHDEEWGVLDLRDSYLFEMLLLETFQAGLSWECVLNKREDFRKAFDDFNPRVIAGYDEKKTATLLADSKIIRNRLKIRASICNAEVFLAIQKEFGSFYNYIVSFFPEKPPLIHHFKTLDQIPATSEQSDAISKDMKKRGFKFFGSTLCYAFLQSAGFVNDHLEGCFCKTDSLSGRKRR